jgi:hypothetical protein
MVDLALLLAKRCWGTVSSAGFACSKEWMIPCASRSTLAHEQKWDTTDLELHAILSKSLSGSGIAPSGSKSTTIVVHLGTGIGIHSLHHAQLKKPRHSLFVTPLIHVERKMMQVACSGRLCLRCLRRLRREPLFLSRSCSRFSSQAGSSASVNKSASTPGARGGGNKRLTAARSIEAFRAGSVPATGRFLHSAQDTNGLIDTILALLPDGPPGYVFFDLDETLIT